MLNSSMEFTPFKILLTKYMSLRGGYTGGIDGKQANISQAEST
ncbi:hypothetical protein J2TS6_26230 [Paenibacillus albilobatus]|uniref:Uncharacterized protein n=1 Tax=Paenibacillus albilobatus TaxID=2716884 RepID=A0A920CCE3_9BACL|nr:hypothetical protein J2TS6_26230 [Paenibacillus albilobatus]